MPIFVIYSNWRAVKIQRFNRISNIDFYLYPKHWIDFFLFHLCCWIIEEHSMHVLHFVEHTKNTHVHLMIRLLERTYFRIFHFQVIDWISNLLLVLLQWHTFYSWWFIRIILKNWFIINLRVALNIHLCNHKKK